MSFVVVSCNVKNVKAIEIGMQKKAPICNTADNLKTLVMDEITLKNKLLWT